MSEAQQLRDLIASMRDLAEDVAHSDSSDYDRAAKYHRMIGYTSEQASKLPMHCECGEVFVKLKTNWHCDGCGRSRKL